MKAYLILAGLFLLVACSTIETNTPAVAPTMEVEDDQSTTQQVIVRMHDAQPDVQVIHATLGDVIVLEVVNQDNRSIVFSVDNYNQAQVGAGASTTLIFEAHTAGNFNYGARDSKQKGILIVE